MAAGSRSRRSIPATDLLALHGLAGTVTGAALGALLGLAGSALPGRGAAAVAIAVGVAAVGLGLANVGGRLERAYDVRDRETPQRWLDGGAARWAILNGSSLALGFSTRVGYWLWYAVPISCLLTGRPAAAALVYGSYGLVRSGLGLFWVSRALSRIGVAAFLARLTGVRRRLLAAEGMLLVAVGVGLVLSGLT